MDHRTLLEQAAAPVLDLLARVGPDDLGSPTPCTEFDVGGLLHHLLTWGPALEAAARKEPAAPSEPPTTTPQAVADQLARVVAAWSEQDAWEGTTTLGSPEPVPASLVGGMVVTEVVVHGWDLARALGEHPRWDPDVEDRVLAEVTATAPLGREMGIYADVVPVPPTAPALDRLLGLTGRDPAA